MSPTPTATTVHVQLLANRQGRPGALLWTAVGENGQALTAWFAHPEVVELARQTPCFWPTEALATWPEAARAAWAAAGMHTAPDTLALCASGFPPPGQAEWVAGTWYLQPPARAASAQSASRTQAMRLLELVASDAETHEIEEVFRHDPTLSYQLLRLVNSAGSGSHRVIASFAQAILLLGRQPLRRWVNLLLFSARDDDPRSAMLMAHVTLRARGMELLAQAAGHDRAQQDQAFMTGMFSMLGELFGQPLAQLLPNLGLTDELRLALLDRTGELGLLLEAWTAAEQADPPRLLGALERLGVAPDTYNHALPQACLWMAGMTAGIGHGQPG